MERESACSLVGAVTMTRLRAIQATTNERR
jgi:hypothetical protein